LPQRPEQIRLAHADLIHLVVAACGDESRRGELEQVLAVALQNGWEDLVRVIRQIVAGRREVALLNGLDEEDTVIAESILHGLQNPASLPDPTAGANPAFAAPGLAHLIIAAGRGDAQALNAVSLLAQQMVQAEGDMRLLGANIKRLVDGERDADRLCQGMSAHGSQLMLSILAELGRLTPQ